MTKAEAWDILSAVVIDDGITDDQYIESLVRHMDRKIERPKEELKERYGEYAND